MIQKICLVTLFLLMFGLFAISCKGKKKAAQKAKEQKDEVVSADCSTVVTVTDYTGLSGCRFLLRQEDGTFLNPSSGIDREILTKTKRAKIAYEKLPKMMSNCMKGKMVKVTCFEVLEEGSPEKGRFE